MSGALIPLGTLWPSGGVGRCQGALGAGRDCRYSGDSRGRAASGALGDPMGRRGCQEVHQGCTGCQGCIGGW